MFAPPDKLASKRSRIEENLIPEGEFLARYAGPVTMKVSVPNMPDKLEWKCDGQMMSVTLARKQDPYAEKLNPGGSPQRRSLQLLSTSQIR